MKPYQLLLALTFVCILVGLQTVAGDPSMQSTWILPEQESASLSDLTPFDTAVVWSENIGSQVLGVSVADYDGDDRDEVAAITQNGTLVLYNEDGILQWSLDLGTTVHAIDSMAANPGSAMEILVGTEEGFQVIAYDQTIMTNVALTATVQTLVGADLNGDLVDEIIVGSGDNRVYAYNVDSSQRWNYTSNSPVRVVLGEDVDNDGSYEVLAGSQAGRFSLIESNGGVVFEVTDTYTITAIAAENLTGGAQLEVVFGNANGDFRAYSSAGSSLYNVSLDDQIRSIAAGELVSGGWPELAIGTSGNELRVFNSTGHLLWNKTLGGAVSA
ncbi:MAG: hypothetical protein ACFE8Z_02830, partial [Candidatus Hermodarchaeota archaeon]